MASAAKAAMSNPKTMAGNRYEPSASPPWPSDAAAGRDAARRLPTVRHRGLPPRFSGFPLYVARRRLVFMDCRERYSDALITAPPYQPVLARPV
jgi:hypothetical protein